MPEFSEIVIVGAGAAGIAAARVLCATGKQVRILEARERAGGRAFTRTINGLPLDIGCGWLHSADSNPLVPLVQDAGFRIDKTLPPWQREPDPGLFPADAHARFRQAHQAFEARLLAASGDEADVAASTLLEEGNCWNPLLDAISTYVNGVELAFLSAWDVTRYHDSEINWRVPDGLGHFVSAMADDLPIDLGCPVKAIDHSGKMIVVETARGDLACTKIIVTVPTNILANGNLRLTPEMPDHLHAAGKLPLGLANKVFLAVDTPHGLPGGGFLIANRTAAASGSYHLCPFGRPIIEGYFGGAYARELEAAGQAAFPDAAIGELCAVLGNDWRGKFKLIASSGWANDPYAQGSYSHALPGYADMRAVLVQPHEGRVYFAGEAVSPHAFSTVHGAWESGEKAARELLAKP